MVRFIMNNISSILNNTNTIYIPIWLDLLYGKTITEGEEDGNLHSNMVRFIIRCPIFRKRCPIFIYIPIWLDLLYTIKIYSSLLQINLHSNMVRFIISSKKDL